MTKNHVTTTVRVAIRSRTDNREAAINGLQVIIGILENDPNAWLGDSAEDKVQANKLFLRATSQHLDVCETLLDVKKEPPNILPVSGNESTRLFEMKMLAKNVDAALWELGIHRRTGAHAMEAGVTSRDGPVAIIATNEGREKLSVQNCKKHLAELTRQQQETPAVSAQRC